MYKFLDKKLKKAVLEIYRVFQEYRAMDFDELQMPSRINTMYERLEEINRQMYQEVAEYYYRLEQDEDELLPDMWLSGLLSTPSKVMKYSYDTESVRKRDRLLEALMATDGNPAEFDTAMRYWAQMTGWFGVEVADAALNDAREASDLEFVKWVSERDDKTCNSCLKLNGKVFRVAALPPKPHPNCRCYTVRMK